MFCHDCGSKLPGNDLKFCPFCGAKQQSPVGTTQTYRQLVTKQKTDTEPTSSQKPPKEIPAIFVSHSPNTDVPDLEAGPMSPTPDELARTIRAQTVFEPQPTSRSEPTAKEFISKPREPLDDHNNKNNVQPSVANMPTVDSPVIIANGDGATNSTLRATTVLPRILAKATFDKDPDIPLPIPFRSANTRRPAKEEPKDTDVVSDEAGNGTSTRFSETAWFMAVKSTQNLAAREGVALDYATLDRMTETYANEDTMPERDRCSFTLRSDD
ncbi:MAG: zinc ribbon domain-containing protein [Myxococcota bacterium]|nr:zinc ribbon domain-containing protein [Myxococcota bacterium]